MVYMWKNGTQEIGGKKIVLSLIWFSSNVERLKQSSKVLIKYGQKANVEEMEMQMEGGLKIVGIKK